MIHQRWKRLQGSILVMISVGQECDETVKRWTARSRSKRKRCVVMSIHGVMNFFLKEERMDN
jgi:hypothetical protein